jgi:hypothetical protein
MLTCLKRAKALAKEHGHLILYKIVSDGRENIHIAQGVVDIGNTAIVMGK